MEEALTPRQAGEWGIEKHAARCRLTAGMPGPTFASQPYLAVSEAAKPAVFLT
jgi:hypothetical protein